MDMKSFEYQARGRRPFSYEQLLLILSCMYLSVGHHIRTGDERPLDDIIQRHPATWTQTLDEDSWDSFGLALTFICPISVRFDELIEWSNHVLDELRRIPERSLDQPIPRLTSTKFYWEQNVKLICLSCGVTSAHPNMSKFWYEDRLPWLADRLSGTVMFPDPLSVEELGSAVNSLALLLLGQGIYVEHKEEVDTVTNTKRRWPFCDFLDGINAKILRKA